MSILTRDLTTPSPPERLPRVQEEARRDRGRCSLVFLAEHKHILAAGAEEGAERGASELGNVWSSLLKNIRQLSIE